MSKNYRDLKVWQKAIDLVEHIYQHTSHFPQKEAYGLTNQMRRCAVSIPSNIAEGQGRGSDKDFIRFLRIAVGSIAELDTQLEIAFRLGYLNSDAKEDLEKDVVEVRKMIYGLISSMQ